MRLKGQIFPREVFPLRSSIDETLSCVNVIQHLMSASKANPTPSCVPFLVQGSGQRLTIPSESVKFRKNGIEFRSAESLSAWTEMTVELETPWDDHKFQAHGIIVACQGSRHSGYVVSMLFTNLSAQSAARLHSLAAGLSM